MVGLVTHYFPYLLVARFLALYLFQQALATFVHFFVLLIRPHIFVLQSVLRKQASALIHAHVGKLKHVHSRMLLECWFLSPY